MKAQTMLVAILSLMMSTFTYAEPVGVNLLKVYAPPPSPSTSAQSGGAGGSQGGGSTVFEKRDFNSANAKDEVTIANGSSANVQVMIYVNRGDPKTTAGINLINCGTVTHVGPGSSVVCSPSGGDAPVVITSDSGEKPASGSYQVK